jgi:predicted HTH transcriptional regulator
MAKLSELELKKHIRGGETNTVELKVAAPRATEMAERLCGMANAQGGIVIIGVKDAVHEIVGVPDNRIGETLDVLLRAARQMIKPELVLDPPEPEIYTLSGKQLVVATVKPSHGPVYQAHGIYWVRRGTHTVSLSLSELLEMANDRGLMDWEHQPVRNATMEDIDLEKVKAYLARRSENSRHTSRFKDIERVLIGMECGSVLLKQAMVVSCQQMQAFYSLALILKGISYKVMWRVFYFVKQLVRADMPIVGSSLAHFKN